MAWELQAWSPFRELERFRRDFDELFDRFFGSAQPALTRPAIESYVEDDRLVVRADLPGVDPKDVEVTVTGNILTIRGSRKSEKETKNRDYLHREVSYGTFERSLTLPEGVKAEEVKASFQNGVLELSIPVPQRLAARKIPVEIAGPSDK